MKRYLFRKKDQLLNAQLLVGFNQDTETLNYKAFLS